MSKAGWAALCAVGFIGFGGQASATIVTAHETGVYTAVQGPAVLFPPGYCMQCSGQLSISSSSTLGGFGADFTFDTGLGVRTTSALQDVLAWDSTMGTPSPILSGHWFATGIAHVDQDLTAATSVLLKRSGGAFIYEISGADFHITSNPIWNSSGPAPYSLDAPFSMVPSNTTTNDSQNFGGYGDATWGVYSQYIRQSVLSPFAVPEPTTWAMLILGFGGIGALSRRRRKSALAL